MRQLRAILCVDDQALVHRIEESLLARFSAEGTRILHAYDGLEALNVLAREPDVDLILLDINMPVLNGLAFLEQRQKTRFAAVPVIVLTNEGDVRDEAAHALTLGATRVLAKPFGYDDLNACIESIYGGASDERRVAERFPISIPIEMRNGVGVTRDVSGLGVYFTAPFPFERGEDLDFVLCTPQEVRCQGTIVRVDWDRESMRYGVAVTVDDYDADENIGDENLVLREFRRYRGQDEEEVL